MAQHHRPSTLAGVLAAAILALLMSIPVHAEVTQEFHKTVPLSADGRVSLSNINGDVEITGWNKSEVQIDAVKTARDQQRLDEAPHRGQHRQQFGENRDPLSVSHYEQ